MPYESFDYSDLLGMKGLSDELLKNHFTLYEGYVKNFNLLNDTIVQLEKKNDFASVGYAEMNRRLGWEFNGMRLHELYFENLSKNAKTLGENSKLMAQILAEFGSHEAWEKDFRGMCAMRGVGWVILYFDRQADRLFNVWINEHDTGHLAGCQPIIICDCFEHAYMLDYGTKRAPYIDAFLENLDWTTVEERFRSCL
jgi:Fe-Mn family superoxide dismutase